MLWSHLGRLLAAHQHWLSSGAPRVSRGSLKAKSSLKDNLVPSPTTPSLRAPGLLPQIFSSSSSLKTVPLIWLGLELSSENRQRNLVLIGFLNANG